MRLTCPNCGAEYEVPDEVIPETGRDVQCSNCGDTWFQHHPDNAPEDADDAADAPQPGWDDPAEERETDIEPEAEPELASEPEPEPEPEFEEESGYEPIFDEDPVEESEAEEDVSDEDPEDSDIWPEYDSEPEIEPQLPPQRELDPAIADLLREEASREEHARAIETGSGLETQPDLGLSDPEDDDDRLRQAKSRMARLRGTRDETETDELPEPEASSRSTLLPDIDEINSSLSSESTRAVQSRAADEGDVATADAAAGQSGGFRSGFMRAVLVVLLLVVLYLLAPVIAENVPALEGFLSTYVDTVNAGRIALNNWLGVMGAPAQ